MSEQPEVAGRFQQSLPAAALLALGLWVGYTSFNTEDPQPYLFPQLISVALVLLSGMALFRAFKGTNRTGAGVPLDQLGRIAPAIGLMLVCVFVMLPELGFYSGSALGFFILFSLYDPASHKSPAVWLKRLVITAGFMTLIYVVFALGLQVQTPRGLFI